MVKKSLPVGVKAALITACAVIIAAIIAALVPLLHRPAQTASQSINNSSGAILSGRDVIILHDGSQQTNLNGSRDTQPPNTVVASNISQSQIIQNSTVGTVNVDNSTKQFIHIGDTIQIGNVQRVIGPEAVARIKAKLDLVSHDEMKVTYVSSVAGDSESRILATQIQSIFKSSGFDIGIEPDTFWGPGTVTGVFISCKKPPEGKLFWALYQLERELGNDKLDMRYVPGYSESEISIDVGYKQ